MPPRGATAEGCRAAARGGRAELSAGLKSRHGITSPSPPAEIKVRGTAHVVIEQDRRERYAAAVREQIGWQPVVGQFALFVVEVADVTYIGSESGTGAQHVARWPSGEEYIRPQLTPTSLGPPQAVSRLLTPDS